MSEQLYRVYDYTDEEDLPNCIKILRRPYEHMEEGVFLLELLDNRFLTPRNIRDAKRILSSYYGIEQKKLESIVIYINEHIRVILDVGLFKFRFFVDYD